MITVSNEWNFFVISYMQKGTASVDDESEVGEEDIDFDEDDFEGK